jgi:hypothetical protein
MKPKQSQIVKALLVLARLFHPFRFFGLSTSAQLSIVDSVTGHGAAPPEKAGFFGSFKV